jgi:hypothetical protein
MGFFPSKELIPGSTLSRMIPRKGKKRTIVAVAHAMLTIAYHLLKQRCPYHEFGADYFDRLDSRALQRRLVHRLTRLGFDVTLTPHPSQP